MEKKDIVEEKPHDQAGGEPISNSKRNVLTIIFAVLAVTACCCILISALLAWFDPFDWNLLARLNGSYDAAAEAAPEDALIYVGIDLLQLTTTEIRQVFEAIAESNPSTTISSPEDALNDLNEELSLNITEDILPWVGQYAGLSVRNLDLDEFGNLQSYDLVFAASVRNRSAAQAFALKFQQQLEADRGSPMRTSEYEGTTIYELTGIDGIAFSQYKNLFLIGSNSEAIRASIDAKNTQSFMETEVFKNLSDQLPAGRIMTGFLTEALLRDFLGELQQPGLSLPDINNAIQYQTMALGLSFVAEGIQLDIASQFDPALADSFQQELIQAYAATSNLDKMLPENTLVYFQGSRPDLSWRMYMQQLESMNRAADIDEAMKSFDDEFGFNPAEELLTNLDGSYMLAVMPSADGFIAAQEIDLGVTLLFETSNPSGLEPVVDALDNIVADEFGIIPTSVEVGGAMFREVNVPFIGELLSYGVFDNFMLIATSTGLASDVVVDGPSLAADPDYQAIWSSFQPGMRPVLYANVSNFLGSMREGMEQQEQQDFNTEVGDSVSWIESVAMANRYDENGIQFSRLIVFVAGIEE